MADNEQLVLSISADTRAMQRQLDKLVGQIGAVDNSLGTAFTKAPKKIDDVTKSLGAAKFQTSNLAAQFQDIAVQLQGGQSPFTVALQQGTQISQVLGQSGATGAVGLLGAAFKSLLSPTSLATIGVIALGGAAVQWAAKALGAVGDLDDRMKAHVELVKSLKTAYGDAAKGVDTSVKESQDVLKALLSISTDKLQKDFQRLALAAAAPGQQMAQFVDDFGRVISEGSDKFAPFRKAIDDFNASVKAGKPDVAAFREAISDTVNSSSDQKVRALGGELLEASKTAGELANNLKAVGAAGKDLDVAALAAAAMNKNFADAMKTLGGTVSKNLDDKEKILKNYNDVLKTANSDDKQMAAIAERDNQLAILSYNDRKKAAEEAASAQEQAVKQFQGAINSQSKQNARTLGAAAGLGDGIGQLTKLETQYKLTEAAQQAFGKVTPEIAAKIDGIAAAAGNAADALAKAKLNSQIEFSAKTSLLSDEDVKIAQQLSGIYGNDVPAALESSYAASIRLNDALKGASSALSNDLTSGLTDIVSGAKDAKAGFSDMAASIIRDIEQMIIKLYIVGPLMKGLQGAAGGLFGGTGSNATDGIGGFGPTAPAGYDDGGFTGRGGKYQPAGIVHKGEFVFDQDAVNRIGVGNLTRLQKGYASGGYVGMPSIPANDNVKGGGGGITINNYGDNQVTAQKTPNGGTLISIRKMVDQAVGDSMSNGTGRRVLSKQYGVNQFMGS